MDKTLQLYKIPDVGDIITVIGVGDELPTTGFSEGDLYIWQADDSLQEAQQSGGVLSWVQIAWDSTKYYRDGSADLPMFYTYAANEYDVSFPANADRKAEITSFTYSAIRMGNAPTISGTLMYRQCLDELWDDRVCVFFNKKFYFIDKIPSSEYSNADARYKHSLEFVSENKLLENVYFTNVVDIADYHGDITKLPMRWLEFSFFGGITTFVNRLNLSLAYSGLDAQHVGFRVVIDSDVSTYIAENVDEPDKLVQISNTSLKAALDMIYELWGVPYWFDGYTIHIGFSNNIIMPIGTTMPTLQYGATQSLLSLQKSQANDIVNRITGLGSNENLPYFYPNKNPNAIELKYLRNNSLLENYAYIANPYKTVNLDPTSTVEQGVPDGAYFKYMPIKKTYTFDQFVSVNTHSNKFLTYDTGVPQLVQAVSFNENLNLKYNTIPIQSGSYAAMNVETVRWQAYKIAYFWLKDGNLETLRITDTCDPYDFVPLDVLKTISFQNPFRGFLNITAYNITKERYDQIVQGEVIDNNIGSGTQLVSKSFSIGIQSTQDQETGDTIWQRALTWNDGSITETYDEVAQFSYNSLPSGTTCIVLRFDIQTTAKNIPYMSVGSSSFDKMWYAETHDALVAKLKDGTQAVFVQTFYDIQPNWSLNANGTATQLYKHGIRLNSGITPVDGDIIYFTREAGALPTFGRLLPSSFRTTKDIWLNAKNNPAYTKEDGQSDYVFENLYKISCAKEHVENFDDIKPTIKGMTNNESPAKRIDQILDVTFDQDDNNDLDTSGENYQHPYFFVKLAKTSANDGYGFNLFDCAIEGQTMKINMANGNCGGCTFEVMVKYQDDGMAINPVGVFEQDTTINGVTYLAGTPKRDLTTGRVLTNRKENDQQDTSAQSVWIALKKDAETFGGDDNGNAVILPDSARGLNFIPSIGDRFTIINICLPYAYIVAAEKRLYYALLDYMEKNNPRTWSFNIKFSSIYYKKNYEFMDRWLSESSRVPFIYNNIARTYYVQSYNYKVTDTSALPEITIELHETAKKINAYFPVPYNPYADYLVANTATTSYIQEGLKKLVLDYGITHAAQNAEIGNLQVNGDITLSDGTSLNAQIVAINSQIFSNEKILTKENAWSKIKSIAEMSNLFYDGLFRTKSISVQTLNSTCRIDTGQTSDFNTLTFSANLPNGAIILLQNIEINENSLYTFSFDAKADTTTPLVAEVLFFDKNGNKIAYTNRGFDITTNYERFVLLATPVENTTYALLSFRSDLSGINIYITSVMVFDQDLTDRTSGGAIVPSVLFPSKFKYHIRELINNA